MQRRIPWAPAALLAALVQIFGCASVPVTAPLPVTTVPAGAQASLPTGEACTTPCTLKVPLEQPVLVSIEAEGFHSVRNILVLRRPDAANALTPGVVKRTLEPLSTSRLARGGD